MAGKRSFIILLLNILRVFPASSTIDDDQIREQCLQDGANSGCVSDTRKPRLPLCCALGSISKSGSCEGYHDPTSVALPSVYFINLTTDGVEVDAERFDMIVSDPCVSKGYVLEPEIHGPVADWYLMKNGWLYLPNYKNHDKIRDFHNYCFWREENATKYIPKLCSTPNFFNPWKITAMLISVPFLVATFAVYMIIPEMRNLHGLTVSGFVGSLALGFATLGLHHFIEEPSHEICLFISFTVTFLFLASFFWMNVMCIDIWLTFGGISSLPGSVRTRNRKQFLMYSIYAWGCPILLTAICAIMDFTPGIPETFIRPEFGEDRCWFRTKAAKGLYFYGPMGLTIICNIILFTLTATKLRSHRKDTVKHLKGRDSNRHNNSEQWFNLYLKLFILMGINWSMEIVSWLWQRPQLIWLVIDNVNTLQGVPIFIIFVCKRKVMRSLMRRFGCREETPTS